MADIYVIAATKDSADAFVERILSGEFPVYGYPNLEQRLKDGYATVTSVEEAEGIPQGIGYEDTLYAPLFADHEYAGKILDIITEKRK